MKWLVLLCCSLLLIGSCRKPLPATISFYYWKTAYLRDAVTDGALSRNKTTTLYLRYFDVTWDEAAMQAIPRAPVQFRDSLQGPVVPVVFIRNEIFTKLRDSAALEALAGKILVLCSSISTLAGLEPAALQIDCDWTEQTSKTYFLFLRALRRQLDAKDMPGFAAGPVSLSVTIRLHQVKYPDHAGIPPADRGMLMFYNMGKINNSSINSIYDRSLSLKYAAALAHYPLPLDMALPVFAWGIHLRDGHVVELLNGRDSRGMERDRLFTRIAPGRYKAITPGFSDGFYFRAGDEVKVEEISGDALVQMAEDIRQYYGKYVREIVFYDLDSHHISRYDPGIFQKTADHIN